jgi:hypothetical protein
MGTYQMGLFDRFFGPPKPEAFARMVMAALQLGGRPRQPCGFLLECQP